MQMKTRCKHRLTVVAAAVCGYLLQTAACSSPPRDLASQWTTTVVDTLIAGFVSDQFNLTGGFSSF